ENFASADVAGLDRCLCAPDVFLLGFSLGTLAFASISTAALAIAAVCQPGIRVVRDDDAMVIADRFLLRDACRLNLRRQAFPAAMVGPCGRCRRHGQPTSQRRRV